MSIIEELIRADQESPKRIIVVGDAMTDVYVYGRIEECQEGCQKFIEEKQIEVPGGAANAARSLQHWRSKVVLLAVDNLGPVKTRFMVGKKCIFRHDDDECLFDQNTAREAVLSYLDEEKAKVDAILLSDYDKGMLTPDFVREIIGYCKLQHIPCVADAKQSPEVYTGAIIKCNFLYSVKHATPCDVCTNGYALPYVRGDVVHRALPSVPCANHVGAGDCFAAHLTLALAHGLSLKDAVAVAYSAGRVYVQKPHNEPPTPAFIKQDMEH